MTQQTKKRLPHPVQIAIVILIMAAAGAILAGAITFSIVYFGMRPLALYEYTNVFPSPAVFGDRVEAYAETPDSLQKGLNRFRVRLKNGSERTVWVWAQDQSAPAADPVERTISTKETLAPTDLIQNLKDADKVGVSFAGEVPFGTVGDFEVPVRIEDLSGNKTVVTSLLHIRVVNDGVAIETGDPLPDPRAFLTDDYAVESVAGLEEGITAVPGEHPIVITIDGTAYLTTLTVTDQKAPAAETKTLFLAPGTMPKPEDFLTNISDGSAVTAVYLQNPDPDSREFQTIPIRITDAAGNSTDLLAGLLFTDIKPVQVEARRTVVTADDLRYDRDDVQLLTSFVPNRLGTYSLHVSIGGEEELAILEVIDTVPPELTAKNKKFYTDHPVEVSLLYDRLYDGTETTVASSEIDWSQEGTFPVALTATDEAGNQTQIQIDLTLIRDIIPPVLYGVQDRTVYAGEPVAYLAEVFASDALDGECEVSVDASAVVPNTIGTYPVIYTATDKSGNTATATCRFTFVQASVSENDLHEAARAILDEITTEDMTTTERLIAVYDYVYDRIVYNGRSDKTDWRKEALNGFRNGAGDCFTYYSALRALLDETEIPYMSVTRKGGATHHYWLLVNVGTGWYHLDANHNARANWRCFMWTNAQCASPAGFWNYETTIYPEVATEPFDASARIAKEKTDRAEQGN